MPSNHNLVCFTHRYAYRGRMFDRNERCIEGCPLVDIGYKARIPKRRDDAGWMLLASWFGLEIGGDDE